MQRPKLLVLASTYPATAGDGTPAFVRDLAIQESEDFDVVVLVPAVPGAPISEVDGELRVRRFRFFPRRWEDLADGAILENLRARRSRWLQVPSFFAAQFLALRRAIREERPDVMHVHWIIPQGFTTWLARARVPFVLTTLGGDLYALNAPPLRRLKRAIVMSASATTAMNQDMLDRLRELGAPADTSVVLPMGADLSAIREFAGDVDPTTRGSGVEILFVGRLVAKKGLNVLIDAARRLRPGSFHITVVGDGPLRGSLAADAADLPMTFAGQLGRADLAREYRRADIVVAPSVIAADSGDMDGMPVALIEAMGMSCAVVASDLPGLNELVIDGENGILVPSGDVQALAEALDGLASDPGRRAHYGEAARASAEALSVREVGRRYRALLTAAMRDS